MTETTTPKPVDFSEAEANLREMRESSNEFIQAIQECDEMSTIVYNTGSLLDGESDALMSLATLATLNPDTESMPLGVPTAWALAARIRVNVSVLTAAAERLEAISPLTDDDRAKLEAL